MNRILIVDDQELFRDSLSIIMKSSDEIEVTGAVASVDEALASIRETMPDAVLMDIRMPGKDGVEGKTHQKQISQCQSDCADNL